MLDDSKPIFQQLAEKIAEDIVVGVYPEETQVPSTNEFSHFYRINPATAGKAVNLLVEEGILYKQRGVGMFVAVGAQQRLISDRRKTFGTQFIIPMLAEASRLGLTVREVHDMTDQLVNHEETEHKESQA